MNFPGGPCSNGLGSQSHPGGNESLSPAAAAVAAVVRQQMQMASAGYHPDIASSFSLPSHLNSSSSNNGGSAGCIPMPKLGSPAAPGQLGNSSGSGIQMPRLASPSIPGLPSSMHGLSGLSSLHMMQGIGGHLSGSGQSSQNPGITITPAHGSSSSTNDSISSRIMSSSMSNPSQSLANAMAQLASPALNIHRISSPAGSIHDLHISSPEEMHGIGGGNGGSSSGGGRGHHSPLDTLENTGLNLAVSSMAYKAARGYTASPRSDLFHEDLSDFMNVQRSASRLSSYKDPTSSSIKIEPMTDCRGD